MKELETIYRTENENLFIVVMRPQHCGYRWFTLDKNGSFIEHLNKSGFYKTEKTALMYAKRITGASVLENIGSCEYRGSQLFVRRYALPESMPDRFVVVGPGYREEFNDVESAFDSYDSICLRKSGKEVCDKRIKRESYDSNTRSYYSTVLCAEHYNSTDMGVRFL